MLKETGLVTKIENGIAWVNTQSKLACSSCQVESTCGNAILEKYLAGKIFVSKIDNVLAAKVGDEVVIAIPKSSLSRASMLVYGVPLLALISGALAGDYLFNNEIASIVFSFVAMAMGLLGIKFYLRAIPDKASYMPKMVSKVSTLLDSSAFNSIKIKNI